MRPGHSFATAGPLAEAYSVRERADSQFGSIWHDALDRIGQHEARFACHHPDRPPARRPGATHRGALCRWRRRRELARAGAHP
ncbi:protein of unknown function [Rhodovastum atsumiense]|nr:protein of unknown function [Rhodovastum atsumiense]